MFALQLVVLVGFIAMFRDEVIATSITFNSCQSFCNIGSYAQMVGGPGGWPAAGFCRTVFAKSVSGSDYSVSASLYNEKGRSNYGHLGILYNAQDMNNFDFVYFRPHSAGGCFQTGHVKNGAVILVGAVSSTCPNGAPPNKSWFTAKVEVHGKSVSIYKDGQLVRVVNSHFAATGKGGVLLANGYDNTIRYKNYQISQLLSHPHPVSACQSVIQFPSYVQMVGGPGGWPAAGFCRTVIAKSVSGSDYSVSASLYNEKGRSNYGHLGILYNAQDMNNFDFVYFRPHSAGGCFQTGHVKNGAVIFAGAVSSTCPNGAPPNKSWFTAKVEVHGKSVSIYKDGQLVRVVNSHFAATGKGGVLLANGYDNTIRYKNYQISQLLSHPHPVSACQSVIQFPSYVQMVGGPGGWPAAGFCRTVIAKSVSGSDYSVSASLYNEKGRSDYGHLGILYNAQDMNNFDFVYFRPHSAGGCFQTGHVKNGAVILVGAVSSTCPNGAPPNKSWFTAKVEVHGKSVSIYKDGQLVRVVNSHFAATGKGGVLLANGYDNTIRYKNYQISQLLSHPHPVSACQSVIQFPSYVQMVGGPGGWPAAGFCRTVFAKSVSGSDYSVSASLYNEKGRSNYGHLGILYNAQDMNNFDFVYFRPHSAGGCFQTGHVKNGAVILVGAVSSTCSNGAPPNKSWFTAKVEVRGKSVSIYKDGQLVRVVNSHFAATGKGGVLLANGYDNTIRYKNYQISQLLSHPHSVSACQSVIQFPSYVQMVGGPGGWPAAGFCRTVIAKSVCGSDYSVSASLYNEKGRSNYGHLGILYNAQDMNNFDFVYFRPHSAGGCFQTGHVKNGAVIFAGAVSSTCPNGAPPNKSWFTAKVEVHGKSVRIYKDGQLVKVVNSHFAATGKGGVLLANGYDNTIRYKNYQISILPH